jgi:hypothetical protein
MPHVFRVMVCCPQTGGVLDTGITTSGREVLNSRMFEDKPIDCRHCGRRHNMQENSFLQVLPASLKQTLWRPNP